MTPNEAIRLLALLIATGSALALGVLLESYDRENREP